MLKKIIYVTLLVGLAGCAAKKISGETYPQVLEDYLKNPATSVLADFSYAGYKAGEEQIPARKDLSRFSVLDYGAVPNDGVDDIDAIQAAIDAAAKAGGGIITFPSGTFDFDVKTEKRFLKIQSSNIILRGNGTEIEGTIFHDHTPSSYPDPSKKWLAGLYPSFVYVGHLPNDSAWHISGIEKDVIAQIKPAPRYSMAIEVNDTQHLKEGDTYLLTMYDPDSSLAHSLTYPLKKLGHNHITSDHIRRYRFQNLITIKKITGTKIELTAPVLWDLKAEWKPQLWAVPTMVTGVGIEGIRMRTDWNEKFIHHLNSIHDDGWDHVRFSFAKDCFVRVITHEAATTSVSLSNSTHCTVSDCQITGNPGHNGFGINGTSTYNLYTNLVGGNAMHTFTIQDYASGNVFFNCYGEEPSSIDCHGGLGVYNLFDSFYGCVFKNGGSMKNIPPALGHKLTFWNWEMGLRDPYHGRMKPVLARYNLIPGFVAVGVKGGKGQEVYFQDENGDIVDTDVKTEWGTIEKLNKKVHPASLYRFQRLKRLGK